MCQSKANGGRRCTGGGGGGTRQGGGGTAVVDRPAATADPARTLAPSCAQTDQMAAALPADRTTFDGQPLSEKDRRFFALRESGYNGPIDQDGYPDTTSEHAQTLRYMAEQRGERVDW